MALLLSCYWLEAPPLLCPFRHQNLMTCPDFPDELEESGFPVSVQVVFILSLPVTPWGPWCRASCGAVCCACHSLTVHGSVLSWPGTHASSSSRSALYLSPSPQHRAPSGSPAAGRLGTLPYCYPELYIKTVRTPLI